MNRKPGEFDIESIARNYAKSKITNLPPKELYRFVNDWKTKPQQARDYLNYFFQRVTDEIKGKKMLDFGCGTGRILTEFSRKGADIFGIDVDREVIEIAKQWGQVEGIDSFRFKCYDGRHIPFDDNYFDYCYSTSTFEHLEDPCIALKELCRVLKPNGRLFLGFPNRIWPFEDHTQLLFLPWLPYGAADKICRILKGRALQKNWNIHFYSYFGFIRVLKKSGAEFTVELPERTDYMKPLKRKVTRALNFFKIHHTALTMYLQLVLRKQESSQEENTLSEIPRSYNKETTLSMEKQRKLSFSYPLYEYITTKKFMGIIPKEFINFFLLSKDRQQKRYFWESFGFLPKDIRRIGKDQRPIWIHANAIGEVNASKPLIKLLKIRYSKKIVLTTKNFDSEKKAMEFKELDGVFFFPYELKMIVKKVLKIINPSVLIIVESESCPNLLRHCKKSGVPVVIVSGMFLKHIHFYNYTFDSKKDIFQNVDIFCMQSEDDASKISLLASPESKIFVSGNLKFNQFENVEIEKNVNYYRKKLSLSNNDKIIVAGSIHKGEEEILLEAFRQLRLNLENLLMISAPRYPELENDIEKVSSRKGIKTVRMTELDSRNRKDDERVIIVDVFGELSRIYSVASVVFMGNSLIPGGLGHNFLEPVAYNKPIIFGPWMINFKEIADLFIERGACLQVNGLEELKDVITNLLTDVDKSNHLVREARKIMEENKDITEKTISCFAHILTR